MKISIVYFSQTGNTEKVSTTLEKTFIDAGHQVKIFSLMKNPPKKLIGQIIGIGAPCFACQAPSPVKEYIASIDQIDGAPAFVFATAGGSPGRVLYDITRLLTKKGARVVGGFLVRGQVSHPGPSIYGRFPGRPNEEDLNRVSTFAVSLLNYLKSDQQEELAESRPDVLRGGMGFYDLVAKTTPDWTIRLLMPKPQLSLDKCNHCNLCVKNCPTNNISDEAYPKIGDACIRCYRCQTVCPKGAIFSRWEIGDIILKILYNPRFEHWFGDIQAGEKVY